MGGKSDQIEIGAVIGKKQSLRLTRKHIDNWFVGFSGDKNDIGLGIEEAKVFYRCAGQGNITQTAQPYDDNGVH